MAPFRVVSNIAAINVQANLNITNPGLERALDRLSSGIGAGLAAANSSSAGAAQETVESLQNRLAIAINLVQSQSVNIHEDRIRDANIAEKSAALMKSSILSQGRIASLAQGSASSDAVLTLLR